MADCVTSLYVKKVESEEFKKWFEAETEEWPYYDSAKGWDVYIEIDGGYGGYFWESLALKMANTFKGIVFKGCNQVIFDDHLIGTTYECSGKEITLKRYIRLPSNCVDEADKECEEELEDMRAFFESENNIPYLATFSVKEVISCFEVYEIIDKKLNDTALVETTCAEHKISKAIFMEFANILNFQNRI